jgi:prevent-host-death family protein
MPLYKEVSAGLLEQFEKTKRPMVLTVNGKAAAVLQDAASYQRLLDIAAQADVNEGMRQGLEDAKEGRVNSARKALAAFRRKHAIPREAV